MTPRWLGPVVLGLMILATACSEPAVDSQSSATSPATQINEAGQVKIAVTWQVAAASPTFTIALDTHSVDLDGYDLGQLALLRTDSGQEAQPIGWDAPKGGHHRSGTLIFPSTSAGGQLLIGPTTRTLALIIRDVAGVPERSFQWAL